MAQVPRTVTPETPRFLRLTKNIAPIALTTAIGGALFSL
jgi:hypothetical protein